MFRMLLEFFICPPTEHYITSPRGVGERYKRLLAAVSALFCRKQSPIFPVSTGKPVTSPVRLFGSAVRTLVILQGSVSLFKSFVVAVRAFIVICWRSHCQEASLRHCLQHVAPDIRGRLFIAVTSNRAPFYTPVDSAACALVYCRLSTPRSRPGVLIQVCRLARQKAPTTRRSTSTRTDGLVAGAGIELALS